MLEERGWEVSRGQVENAKKMTGQRDCQGDLQIPPEEKGKKSGKAAGLEQLNRNNTIQGGLSLLRTKLTNICVCVCVHVNVCLWVDEFKTQ